MKTALWFLGMGVMVLGIHAGGFYALTTLLGLWKIVALIAMIVIFGIVGVLLAKHFFEEDDLIYTAVMTLIMPNGVLLTMVMRGKDEWLDDNVNDWRNSAVYLACSCIFLIAFYIEAFMASATMALGAGFAALVFQVLIAAALPRERETESCS